MIQAIANFLNFISSSMLEAIEKKDARDRCKLIIYNNSTRE